MLPDENKPKEIWSNESIDEFKLIKNHNGSKNNSKELVRIFQSDLFKSNRRRPLPFESEV